MSLQPPQRPRYQPEETELIRAYTWLLGLNIFMALLIIFTILAAVACVVGFCVLMLIALSQVAPPSF